MNKVEGKVSRVLYQNERNYYTILLFREDNGITFSVVGYFPLISESLRLTLFGSWKNHKQHGKQFETSSYEIMEPKDTSELITFLTSSLVDCSYQVAFDIAKKMGLRYLKEFSNIAACKKQLPLREETERNLIKNSTFLLSFYEKKTMLEELLKMGFEQEIACKMAFSEVPPPMHKIKQNPYFLIRRFDLSWNTIDGIALKNGIGKKSTIRIEEGILYLLELASNEHAHMYLPQAMLEKTIQQFLKIEFEPSSYLDTMENEQKIVRDLKDRIYSEENHRLEKLLAENLYRLSKGTPVISTSSSSIKKDDFNYSDDQLDAIKMPFDHQVSVISGPAGTGKTTIISKIIKEFKRLKYDIQLCAPTGRAAKRMMEVTGLNAKTVHHILGFNSETKLPSYNRSSPLGKTCYIVDEASMLDIKIASYLVDAIPDGSKLIIIGDEHQLPSIGPGTVLKDLLECELFPVKRLNQVFRQSEGSYLLDYATKIRNGESLDVKSLPKKCDFKHFNLSKTNQIKEGIRKLVTGFVQKGLYDIFDDLQIISPIHKGPIGVKELNSMIQDIINPNAKTELVYGSKVFRTGDKVIQLVNNPDKNVYNGDIGKIESISKKGKSIIVNYSGERMEYISEEIFELDLAYALTVHKVQGGEYPFVIMPFHSSFGTRMINRKLFYTAATRAKKQFVLLSDEATIQQAIDNNGSETRYCNLIGRLKEARLKTLFKAS